MLKSTELPAPRRGLELLTSIKAIDSTGAITTKCFGNILELGSESLVLESHREQTPGSALSLKVVFPGQQPRTNPVVTLDCVVRRVRDRIRLHYDLAIEDMDDQTRERLFVFLREPERRGKNTAEG